MQASIAALEFQNADVSQCAVGQPWPALGRGLSLVIPLGRVASCCNYRRAALSASVWRQERVSITCVLATRHWQTEQHDYSYTEEHDDLFYAINMMAVKWQNLSNNSKT